MTATNENNIATLADGLDQQIDAMKSVRACLEAEHRALHERDPEQLLAAVERKQVCMSAVERIDRRCRDLGEIGDDEGVDGDRKREQLEVLARVCRELNDANGQLIRRQQARVETTLHILRGGAEPPAVYGPSGGHNHGGTARKILASV